MTFLNWPYVEGTSAWGENTSKYNWCEMDNYLTPYIAEFINTLTNLGYIYLGVKGIVNNRKIHNDTVINLCYVLLASIGIGSGIYHANPKYFSQMIDEVLMLYATAAILYGALSIRFTRTARKFLSLLLIAAIVSVSVVHCYLGHVKAFRRCFFFMVLSVFTQCVFLLSTKVPDVRVRDEVRNLAIYGSVTFVAGFAFWILDRRLCGQLTAAREIVGMPLGFVTEFHGWWHILTGVGVYYYIVFIEYLRLYIASRNDNKSSHRINLIWNSRFFLPRLELIPGVSKKKL